MSKIDVRKQFSLLADFIEAFSDFLVKVSQIEKEGFSVSQLRNVEYWSKVWREVTNILSKDEFLSLMGVLYDFGEFSSMDLSKLDADEKIKVGNEVKRLAQQIKKLFEGGGNV